MYVVVVVAQEDINGKASQNVNIRHVWNELKTVAQELLLLLLFRSCCCCSEGYQRQSFTERQHAASVERTENCFFVVVVSLGVFGYAFLSPVDYDDNNKTKRSAHQRDSIDEPPCMCPCCSLHQVENVESRCMWWPGVWHLRPAPTRGVGICMQSRAWWLVASFQG